MPDYKDPYITSIKRANTHRMLYHYTSTKALYKIIKSRKLRLSRLSLVNDPLEGERLDSYTKDKVYVACFNHYPHDSIPLWAMYVPGRDRARPFRDGVRIAFPHENTSFLSDPKQYTIVEVDRRQLSLQSFDDWRLWGDPSLLDVVYDDDFSKFIMLKDVYDDDSMKVGVPNAIGYLKKKCWAFEGETRLRVAFRHTGLGVKSYTNKGFEYIEPPFEYIYCNVPNETLQNMQIMFSPCMDDALCNKIQKTVKGYFSGFDDRNFVHSSVNIRW